MSQFTLSIQQPFKQDSIAVKWVSITSPSGSFVVGPGHRPLVSAVEPESTVVYDMMYGKEPTPFMDWATRLDARQAIDGLGMLIEQAAESFSVWHGKMPNTTDIRHTLRDA